MKKSLKRVFIILLTVSILLNMPYVSMLKFHVARAEEKSAADSEHAIANSQSTGKAEEMHDTIPGTNRESIPSWDGSLEVSMNTIFNYKDNIFRSVRIRNDYNQDITNKISIECSISGTGAANQAIFNKFYTLSEFISKLSDINLEGSNSYDITVKTREYNDGVAEYPAVEAHFHISVTPIEPEIKIQAFDYNIENPKEPVITSNDIDASKIEIMYLKLEKNTYKEPSKTLPDEAGKYQLIVSYNEKSNNFVCCHKADECFYVYDSETDWYDKHRYADSVEEDDRYEISTAKELYGLSKVINKRNASDIIDVYLTEDINLNEGKDVLEKVSNGDTSDLKEWIPIGNSIKGAYVRFHGQGHTIKGLYMQDSTAKYAGFFGYASYDSEIRDVSIVDSYIEGDNNVGGVCGYGYYSIIKNCSFEGIIEGKKAVGGIVGKEGFCDIIDSSFNGKVNGDEAVGGIAGYSEYMQDIGISKCKNTGDISGNEHIGGIAGFFNYNFLANCNNKGNISGEQWIGGICGEGEGYCTIVKTDNYGNIIGTKDSKWIGGIAGKRNGGVASFCSNYGKVSGGGKVGGIFGECSSVIDYCCNAKEAIVTGKSDYVGGVVGYIDSPGGFCRDYNEGTVIGYGKYTGGIAGKSGACRSEYTHNTGIVISDGDYAGGIFGSSANADTRYCYNAGKIENKGGYTGGIIGGMEHGQLFYVYNYGSVTGVATTAGICGSVDEPYNTLFGLCNTGEVKGEKHSCGGLFGEFLSEKASTYSLKYGAYNNISCCSKAIGYKNVDLDIYNSTGISTQEINQPDEFFRNGKIAYGLYMEDSYTTENSPYSQNIGFDKYPIFDNSHRYPILERKCLKVNSKYCLSSEEQLEEWIYLNELVTPSVSVPDTCFANPVDELFCIEALVDEEKIDLKALEGFEYKVSLRNCDDDDGNGWGIIKHPDMYVPEPGTYEIMIETQPFHYVKDMGVYYRKKTFTKKISVLSNGPGKAKVSLDDWMYGEEAKEPHSDSQTNDTQPIYYYKERNASESEYTTTVPSAPGKYTVKVVYPAYSYYDQAVATDDFCIMYSKVIKPEIAVKKEAFYKVSLHDLISVKNNYDNSGIDDWDNLPLTIGYQKIADTMAGADKDKWSEVSVSESYEIYLQPGTYSIRGKFDKHIDDNLYIFETVTSELIVQIKKAEGEAEISMKDYTASQTGIFPQSKSTNDSEPKYTYYKYADSQEYYNKKNKGTITNGQPKEAGYYRVEVTYPETEYYTEAEAECYFIVRLGTGMGSVTMEDWIYGETPSNPLPETDTSDGCKIDYKYYNLDTESYIGSTRPTEAGEYKVEAHFGATKMYSDFTASAKFKIARRKPAVTVTSADYYYNQTVEPQIVTDSDTAQFLYQYKNKGEQDSKYSVGLPTEIGQYIVKIICMPTKNCLRAVGTGEYNIVKAPGQACVEIGNWSYGEAAKVPSSSSITNEDGSTPLYEYAVKGTEEYSTTVPKSGGDYTLRVSYPENEHYQEAIATTNFSILPAKGRASVRISDWNYGDDPSVPIAVSETNLGMPIFAYKLKGADDSNYSFKIPEGIGRYVIKATFFENSNYEEAEAFYEFNILKGRGVAQVQLDNWHVNEIPNEPVAVSTTNTGSAVFSYAVRGSDCFSAVKPTGVGKYTVKAEFPENELYERATATSDFEIEDIFVDKEAPSQPDGLGIIKKTGSSVTISWSKSTDNVAVKGYNVYRDGIPVALNLADTVYKDTGLTLGEVCHYTVSALDEEGNESEQSKEITGTIAGPEIVDITPCNNTVFIENKVDLRVYFTKFGDSVGNTVNIDYRIVGEDTDVEIWHPVNKQPLSQEHYNATTLSAGCEWHLSDKERDENYIVRFTLTDGDGNSTSKEMMYSIDRTAPYVPASFSAVSDNGNVELSWSPSYSGDAITYHIYRKGGLAVGFVRIADVDGRFSSSYTDKNVQQQTTYTYVITAEDDSHNESDYSKEVDVIVGNDCSAPEVIRMLPEGGRVNKTVNINASAQDNKLVAKITFYIKKAEQESEQWSKLAVCPAENDTVSYKWDSTTVEDGEYYIRAMATDTSGNLSKSEYIRRYEVDNTGIKKIQINKVHKTSNSIQLLWDEVPEPDFDYFQVEEITEDGRKIVSTDSSELGVILTGLKPNQEYKYIIVGYDNLGNRGKESDVITVQTEADNEGPIIESIGPVASRFKNSIPLEMTVTDHSGIRCASFSYSLDGVEFKKIVDINNDNQKKHSTFQYSFDVTDLPEGKIYIKYTAVDIGGNGNQPLSDGSEVINQYIIDRTAPRKVENLNATSTTGYIGLIWSPLEETDLKGYRVYRAEVGTENYQIIQNLCTTYNYYDTDIEMGTSYHYIVSGIDDAGNEGKTSDILLASAGKDTKAPEILGISPKNDEYVGKCPDIQVAVSDNVEIKKISLEYKGENDEIWNSISETEICTSFYILKEKWDTSGLPDGKYIIRTQAEDIYGNVSELSSVSYALDQTGPEKARLNVQKADFQINLTFSASEIADFSHFTVLRKKAEDDDSNYQEITVTDKGEYCDKTVQPNVVYDYKVRTYDKCGNYCDSNVVTTYATDNDTVKPVAVLPENISGLTGKEVCFDGTMSSDNVGIRHYAWRFGDGDTADGATVSHTYKEPGTYTVVLQVTDQSGNKSRTSTSVKINREGSAYAKVSITDSSDNVIPHAVIYIKKDGDERKLTCDRNGCVEFSGEAGTWKVAAYSEGYIPNDKNITLKKNKIVEETLKLKKGDLVEGKLTTKQMTLEEMEAAGVDFSNPANINTYQYHVTVTLAQEPIPVEFIYIGTGKPQRYTYRTKKGEKRTINISVPSPIQSDNKQESNIVLCESTEQTVSWLKDMYTVNLGVLNTAERSYVLQNSKAVLELPDGISLEETSGEQSLTHYFGDIKGQESASVTWIVKGDTSGYYKLRAGFEGTLMPFHEVYKTSFETEKEFQVLTGEGLHIYVMPEKAAYQGSKYYIQFKIVNESDRTFYNLQTSMGNYLHPDYYDVTRIIDTGNPDNSEIMGTGTMYRVPYPQDYHNDLILQDGDKLSVGEFGPQEVLYGTYVKAIPRYEFDDETFYFRLAEQWVTVLKGENLGVKVDIIPIDSHIYKSIKKIVYRRYTYGDPIDLSSGAFTDEFCAMSFPVTENSYDATYDSMQADSKGELGYGWQSNFESRITDENGVLKWYSSADSYVHFVNEAAMKHEVYGTLTDEGVVLESAGQIEDIRYVSSNKIMRGFSLIKHPNHTYTLEYPDGGKEGYDEKGELAWIANQDGFRILVTRTGDKKVIKDETTGMSIIVKYKDGLVREVTDGNGRRSTFYYQDSCLIRRTDENGDDTIYRYDDNHHIVSETNALGVTYVRNAYDEAGRVLKQCNAEEKANITMSYATAASEVSITAGDTVSVVDERGNHMEVVSDGSGHVTRITNQKKGESIFQYDIYGNLISEKDSLGNIKEYTYTEKNRLASEKDASGCVTKYAYDSDGNLKTITYADHTTEENIYNNDGKRIQSKDRNGNITKYVYNTSGQKIKEDRGEKGSVIYHYKEGLLTGITDSNGNKSVRLYDKYGNVSSVTDSMGNECNYEYDRKNRLICKIAPDGGITSYTYDCNGNKTSETDAMGNQTVYQYDGNGRLVREIKPDGNNMTYTYDMTGNKLSEEYPDGTAVKYVYDAVGNVTEEIGRSGKAKHYTYDALNQKTSETDERGNKTRYFYDSCGNLVRTEYEDGTSKVCGYNSDHKLLYTTDEGGNTVTYNYDSNGNLIGMTDALGNKTAYILDRNGNIVSVTDPNGNTTRYLYDNNDNLIKEINPAGNVTEYSYDACNRLVQTVRVASSGSVSCEYQYDKAGRVTKLIDEEGNTSSVKYNKNGDVVSMIDALGNEIQKNDYDTLGNVRKSTDALGNVTEYDYDEMGNLTETVNNLNTAAESSKRFDYDNEGRLTAVSDEMEGNAKASYDAAGNLTEVTDANGGTTSYQYDKRNRLIQKTNAIGSKYTYTYNAAGLISEKQDAGNRKTFYTYDANGRITGQKDDIGSITYTYDGNGNILTVSDENGVIKRTYDELNRVISYTNAAGNTIKYQYDGLGNLKVLTYPDGEKVRYGYYKTGWLKTVTDGRNRKTAYSYDANGRLTEIRRPDGTVERDKYNKAGWLIAQEDTKNGELIGEYRYQYDENGNVVRQTESDFLQSNHTEVRKLSDVSMQYDKQNRMVCYNGETIRYDAEGNMIYGPVNGKMTELKYDCRNRLIEAGGVSYTYDAENNRIMVETGDYTEQYATDSVNELSRTLMIVRQDKETNNIVTRKLYYGDALLYESDDVSGSLEGREEQAETLKVYHYNNIGSTMLLTDADGEVTSRFIYGAYGELLYGDADATNYLYNGKYGVSTDANGLYYMRARFYNPEIKRFVNQDILSGELTNTQSLNLYSYVQGNPITLLDPFGLSPSSGNGAPSMPNQSPGNPQNEEEQDILREAAHSVFGMLSMIPGYGVPFGLLNAAMYLQEGDYTNAGLSVVGAITNVSEYYELAKGFCTVVDGLTYFGEIAWGAVKDDDQTAAMGTAATFEKIGEWYNPDFLKF